MNEHMTSKAVPLITKHETRASSGDVREWTFFRYAAALYLRWFRGRLVPKNFHPKIFTSSLNTCMKH